MNEQNIPTSADALSRRAVLRRVIVAGAGLASLPALKVEAAAPPPAADYVPENDYPFFGYEPQPE